MFDIAFISDEPPFEDEEGTGLWGCTVLGDFSERFIAPLGWWEPADYERQWLDGAERLLRGESPSAFTVEAGWVWWTAWREGADVFVHQRTLVLDEMAPAWTAMPDDLPYALIGPRNTHSAEGTTVSQWRVSIDDVRDFVARRRAGG
jgi:hypothetical protein